MKKAISTLILFSIYFSFISQVTIPINAQILGKTMEQKQKDLPPGLKFRLSEGVEGAEQRERQPLAATDPL